MPTSLITGASGYCARHLVARLRSELDMRIFGLARSPLAAGLDGYSVCDVRDSARLAQLIRELQPDLVFHLAGIFCGTPEDIYQTNFMGTAHLLQAIAAHAPRARVLLVGSAAEYGRVDAAHLPVTEHQVERPRGAYAISKHAATLAGLDSAERGLKLVIARPFNIVGAGVPRTLVVGAALERLKQCGTTMVRTGNLDTQRDFVDVGDVVDAYVRMMREGPWGEIFNLCSGQPRSIRAVLEGLFAHDERAITLQPDPQLCRALDMPIIYGSWRKAHASFGFAPTTPLETSLRAAWRHEFPC